VGVPGDSGRQYDRLAEVVVVEMKDVSGMHAHAHA
jgi:hypothetical protein